MGMGWAELIGEMAALSKEALKDKRFGKRREKATPSTPAPFKEGVKKATGPKPRSISKGKRSRVWERDGGACVKCGGQQGLQVDHIVPVARGGGCEEENLRLLCFGCNVREGVKEFGLERMKRGDMSQRGDMSPSPPGSRRTTI